MTQLNPPAPPTGHGLFLGDNAYLIVRDDGTGTLTTRTPDGHEYKNDIRAAQLETFAYRLNNLIGQTR